MTSQNTPSPVRKTFCFLASDERCVFVSNAVVLTCACFVLSSAVFVGSISQALHTGDDLFGVAICCEDCKFDHVEAKALARIEPRTSGTVGEQHSIEQKAKSVTSS